MSSNYHLVLIVEDNPAQSEYLEFLLKKLNIDTITASNSEEALNYSEKQDFDGAFIDINLGNGLNGIELVELLRQKNEYSSTPMVAVTANTGTGIKDDLLFHGFTDYLPKPISFDDLRSTVI